MATFLPASLFAFGIVVLAEMGDKTQLLAMAFAAKYSALKVMIGVFVATILNHALAVAVGHFITRLETIQHLIQALASLSFILFGLWTIKGDRLEGEEHRTTKFGTIFTVAAAFFLAEMGDKTQLATIAIAAKFPKSPAGVLTGTTMGMLVADGLGILIGHVLQKKIPEQKIKIFSAAIFIVFGLIGTYEILRDDFMLGTVSIVLILILIIIITGFAAYRLLRGRPKPR